MFQDSNSIQSTVPKNFTVTVPINSLSSIVKRLCLSADASSVIKWFVAFN